VTSQRISKDEKDDATITVNCIRVNDIQYKTTIMTNIFKDLVHGNLLFVLTLV